MFKVPANVFARDPDAMELAIGPVQLREVPLHDCQHFGRGRGRKLCAGVQVMPDLTENPGVALRGPADHQAFSPGVFKHFQGLLRCLDIAVGEHGDGDRFADRTDRFVFCLAFEAVRAGSAVYGQGRNTRVFRHPGDFNAIAHGGVGAGSDFQCDRHINRPYHGVKNQADLHGIGEEC